MGVKDSGIAPGVLPLSILRAQLLWWEGVLAMPVDGLQYVFQGEMLWI
jgi:hypothetical protein